MRRVASVIRVCRSCGRVRSRSTSPRRARADASRIASRAAGFPRRDGWDRSTCRTRGAVGERREVRRRMERAFSVERRGRPRPTGIRPTRRAGDYTVKATFTEPKFQNLNSHPHPYGIVIAGNDLGTANGTYLYCAVNGNGSFIVRGMGPRAAFQMNGRSERAQNAADAQGCRRVGETGDERRRGVGQGRQGHVRHQRHRGRDVLQG